MPDEDLTNRLKAAIARRSPDTLSPVAARLWRQSARLKERKANPPPPPEAVWCLVANVAEFQPFGPDHEIRLGTKHFSPNTKVYCYPGEWGDGYENIRVIGRHRGSSRLATIIMPRWRLTNWRVKLVRHPHVVATMGRAWTEESAHEMVPWLQLDEAALLAKRAGYETVPADDALLFASRHGLVDEVERALARDADLGVRRSDMTPLSLALGHRHFAVVRLLVARGADVNAPCGRFDSAIAMAQVYGTYDSVLRDTSWLDALNIPVDASATRGHRWQRLWRGLIRLLLPPNGQAWRDDHH